MKPEPETRAGRAAAAARFRAVASSRLFRALLPVFLAALFTAGNYLRYGPSEFYPELQKFTCGAIFLSGAPGEDMTYRMPLFGVCSAAALHLGAGPAQFFAGLHLAVYALVFLAGCLLHGFWAGIAALTLSGLLSVENGYIYEQTFYSLFLLLVLVALARKSRENTVKNSVLAGLAVGASLLIRSPLFLFPPAAVACEWAFSKDRSREFVRRSLFFLAAAYVLLLPWGLLNRSLHGRFTLFESERANGNILTAAKGSIFTMQGDRFRLEDPGGQGPVAVYLRAWRAEPLFQALTVLRRLWEVFLLHPLVFLIFLALLPAARWRDQPLALCLPLYYILIHALLSIQARYFYPLRYLLPPVLAAAAASLLAPREPGGGAAWRASAAALYISAGLALATLALASVYPWRSARAAGAPDAYARAARLLPRDGGLHYLECRERWRNGDDAGFRRCLGAKVGGFEYVPADYFLAVYDSTAPAAVPLPAAWQTSEDMRLQCLIIRMLREFELGRVAAGTRSLREAQELFSLKHNTLQSTSSSDKNARHWLDRAPAPYARDRELEAFLKTDSDWFWKSQVFQLVTLWPPRRIAAILSRIPPDAPLGDSFSAFRKDLALDLAQGEKGERALRGRIAAAFGIRTGGRPAAAAAGRPGSDARPARAPREPGSPQDLLKKCRDLAGRGEPEQALPACQGALFLAASELAPGAAGPDASLEMCKVLKALGRDEEAAAALAWALDNAPRDWPGREQAERLLHEQP